MRFLRSVCHKFFSKKLPSGGQKSSWELFYLESAGRENNLAEVIFGSSSSSARFTSLPFRFFKDAADVIQLRASPNQHPGEGVCKQETRNTKLLSNEFKSRNETPIDTVFRYSIFRLLVSIWYETPSRKLARFACARPVNDARHLADDQAYAASCPGFAKGDDVARHAAHVDDL